MIGVPSQQNVYATWNRWYIMRIVHYKLERLRENFKANWGGLK